MENNNQKKNYLLSASILVSALILSGALVYITDAKKETPAVSEENQILELQEKVIPSEGTELPIVWGDLGAQLVDAGVIDAEKFKTIYQQRGLYDAQHKELLLGEDNGEITITQDNAGYLLNLFWALGLANKNPILENGEMTNPAYGGAGNFASTGGWTLSVGDSMDHYSKHTFFNLTEDQQALVDRMSQGIYRPCCGNSTHFPDCNHGMAMLGLLELMASQGISEQEMWDTALAVNSYWFPDTYITIAMYMENKGVKWEDVDPQEVLGSDYSSASGYSRIAAQVTPPDQKAGGGGCSV